MGKTAIAYDSLRVIYNVKRSIDISKNTTHVSSTG